MLEDLSHLLLGILAEARSSWSAAQGNHLSAPRLLSTGCRVVTRGIQGLLAEQAPLDLAAL